MHGEQGVHGAKRVHEELKRAWRTEECLIENRRIDSIGNGEYMESRESVENWDCMENRWCM